MHETKEKLDNIRNEVDVALGKIDLRGLKLKIKKLNDLSQQSDFWDDRERAQSVSKELADLQKEVNEWEKMASDCKELTELFPSIDIESDPEGGEEFKKMVADLETDWRKLEVRTFLGGKYDKYGVIMSIHAGTGGKDAMDWAGILLRMYMRWCEKRGYDFEIFDKSDGEEVGVKSATMHIKGLYAYGYLKGERGVHRLVRLSPFNTKHTRETSFAFVDVLPDLPDEEVPEIQKDDLKTDTFRASGAGGQNVNKVSSAVRITHVPTGLVVACQSERSQHQNKERAMKILQAKLVDMVEQQKVSEINELRGERVEMSWGNQIRSYVMQPYTMVKDHRNGYEEHNVDAVFDGDIDGFLESHLKGNL